MNLPELQFVSIAPDPNTSLGWRFDNVVPNEIRPIILNYLQPAQEQDRCFSPMRTVTIEPFQIASETFPWESLLEWDDEAIDTIETLTGFCDLLDSHLKSVGLRLPTQDELEIACGGDLFPWGNEFPDGIPYGDMTEFKKHKTPNEYNIMLNSNTYNVEVTRTALKLGDGGTTVCGAYEWPIPWLSFCPAFVVSESMLKECLTEFIEDAQIRPVMIG